MTERSTERCVRQETGWLSGGPLLRVATIRRTTDTFLVISHTTNVLLFKFRCNIFIGVRIIKEMPGSVASGTHCIYSIKCQIVWIKLGKFVYVYGNSDLFVMKFNVFLFLGNKSCQCIYNKIQKYCCCFSVRGEIEQYICLGVSFLHVSEPVWR
jgi:hypothetical protein